jgi:hypothetical protein
MSWSERGEKSLLLLRFALDRKGIDPASYFMGKLGDERHVNDRLCLLDASNGKWSVLYIKGGVISGLSCHSSLFYAGKDFFLRITGGKAHWAYKEAWEKEMGQTL